MSKHIIFCSLICFGFISTKAQDCLDSAFFEESEPKESVSVALILPLDLDVSIENNKLSETKFDRYTKYSYNAYQGAMLALDSIENLSADLPSIKFYVIDSKSDSLGIDHWLEGGFKGMDLIFSGLTKENNTILENISDRHIPLIAMTSLSTPKTAYEYYIQVQPTLSTHCKRMYEHILATSDEENSNLFTITSAKDVSERAIQYASLDTFPNVSFSDLKDFSNVSALLDSSKTNIIFAAILNTELAESLLQELQDLEGFKIVVYGMPTWSGILTNSYATGDIEIYYTSGFYKFSDTKGADFITRYQSRYDDQPNTFAFKGYESVLYTLSRYFDTERPFFENLYDDQKAKPINNFKFEPICEGDKLQNWENTNVYFLRNAHGNIDLE